jgi:hypothetical protein
MRKNIHSKLHATPSTTSSTAPSTAPSSINCISPAELALHDTWRSLWEQHVAWTRMTIISAVFSLPDMPAVSSRLLQNANDMGAAMQPYYGDTVAVGFSTLIRNHLLIAINLVSTAKAGDIAAAAKAESAWYANANDIAAFMASINPYWPQQTVQDMFYQHLALTKAEAVAMLSGDYQKSVGLYDEIERQALGMADAVSGGIARQFGL